MKNVMPKTLGAILLAALAVLPLCAADWYVKSGGTGRGTAPDAATDEIWKALEKAVRGDVIHVAEGTYNGKAGSGHFIIKVPNLSLVGGYSADFAERNPFKHFTILERAADFKGDWTGLPEAIVAGDQHEDQSNFTLDGFVLNAESRNYYKDNVLSLKAPTYPGMLVQTNSPNTRIRNNILLNPAGDGIYCTWQGKDNEIVNNFIVNTFYAAIETRSAQPGSKILIRNNTIAFGWFYPSKGGHMGIFVGRQGETVIDSNVFAFIQTEAEESGFAVSNTFGNSDTVMKNNVYFSANGGYYKYMDGNKQSLVVWKPAGLADLNDPDLCADFMLAESGGNREADPGINPDKEFATKFANFMDAMNQWRQAVGLPLQAEAGSARKNYGFPYPLAVVVPNLVSKIAGVGASDSAPLAVYKSEAAAAGKLSYETVEFDSFKKGGANAKGNTGRPVQFKAGLGDPKMVWELAEAPRSDYLCYQATRPGAGSATTMDAVYVYILKGSPAAKSWDTLFKKRAEYFAEGVNFKGRAFDFKTQSYAYPVGIIIDEIRK
jgi:hypothetical protein